MWVGSRCTKCILPWLSQFLFVSECYSNSLKSLHVDFVNSHQQFQNILFFVFSQSHICIKNWLCSSDGEDCWLTSLMGVGWFQCVFIIRVCKLDVDLVTEVNDGWTYMRAALKALCHVYLLHLCSNLQLPWEKKQDDVSRQDDQSESLQEKHRALQWLMTVADCFWDSVNFLLLCKTIFVLKFGKAKRTRNQVYFLPMLCIRRDWHSLSIKGVKTAFMLVLRHRRQQKFTVNITLT